MRVDRNARAFLAEKLGCMVASIVVKERRENLVSLDVAKFRSWPCIVDRMLCRCRGGLLFLAAGLAGPELLP